MEVVKGIFSLMPWWYWVLVGLSCANMVINEDINDNIWSILGEMIKLLILAIVIDTESITTLRIIAGILIFVRVKIFSFS